MRILLVDDDRELIDLLAFALKRAGLEPIAAHDAASGLRQFDERQPDLVVLDINLGPSSGLDVLKELRIRAQLRRTSQELQMRRAPETRLEVGSVTLDLAEHTVTKAGQQVSLTVTEFRLLHALMSNAGTVVPTSTLLKQVWGYQDAGGSDVVRVTVHRLRRKLESDPARPHLLHTIPGVGFLLKAEGESAASEVSRR